MKPNGIPNDLGDLMAVGSADAGKIPVVDANGNFILANPWPVGSLFIAAVSTNPATLLGFGTWAAFGAGRVLVGIDTGQAEFDTLEKTGGAKAHALTADENGPHTHGSNAIANAGYGPGGNTALDPNYTGHNTLSSGSGTPHNNLQPYIVVYMWKRTA